MLSEDPLDLSQPLGRSGSTASKQSTIYGTGLPQGWTFDQDDHYPAANGSSTTDHGPGPGGVLPFAGSKAFNGVGSHATDDLRGAGPPRSGGGGGGALGGFWKQLGQGRLPCRRRGSSLARGSFFSTTREGMTNRGSSAIMLARRSIAWLVSCQSSLSVSYRSPLSCRCEAGG